MLKMIIVDDEKIIRETIHSLKPLTVFWMNTRILS